MVAKIAGRLSDHQVSLSTCESEVMIQQIASDSGKKKKLGDFLELCDYNTESPSVSCPQRKDCLTDLKKSERKTQNAIDIIKKLYSRINSGVEYLPIKRHL